MKITSITTEEFRWPRRVPIRNGKHTYTHSGLGIVKIETDKNATGIGLGGRGPGVDTPRDQPHRHRLVGTPPQGGAHAAVQVAGWIPQSDAHVYRRRLLRRG